MKDIKIIFRIQTDQGSPETIINLNKRTFYRNISFLYAEVIILQFLKLYGVYYYHTRVV